MTLIKKVKQVLPKPTNYGMVGDGFRVYNYFPNGYPLRENFSPFLMLDFNPEFDFGPSSKPRGVGVHPHKGFETVTIAYKGHVAHHDSTGNSGVIHPGDVQWMTAGDGILHKEYHEKEFSKNGGPFEMVQLWVNLPAKYKSEPAGYQSITSDAMARYQLPSNKGFVKVIAGNFKGIHGAAKTFTPITIADLRLEVDAELDWESPAEYNTAILVINGKGTVNGSEFNSHDFVLFENEGETIKIKTQSNSTLLFLSGAPIMEPIAQYGPFVMNSMQEIYQAIEEFNSGKFGFLE